MKGDKEKKKGGILHWTGERTKRERTILSSSTKQIY